MNSQALMQTTVQLDNSRAMCTNLEEKILQKDVVYAEREKELCMLHRSEMELGEKGYSLLFKYNILMIY